MKNRAYLLVLYAKKFVNHSYQPNTSDSMDSMEVSHGIDFVEYIYLNCLKKNISNEIEQPKQENEKQSIFSSIICKKICKS